MKEDKRKNNGGHKTAGRKPKAEEQKLIQKLSPLEQPAFNALKKAINKGENWAVKMYFEYMFGKPKERKDHSGEVKLSIEIGDNIKTLFGRTPPGPENDSTEQEKV